MQSTMTLFPTKTLPAHVLYITDMEGGHSFFTFINKSNLVTYDPNHGLCFNKKYKNAYFIYGGDATDHGSDDLAITKALIDFKIRNPDNVFLIAGNREITKNRLKIELAPEFIRKRLMSSLAPRWLTKDQQTVPLDYIVKEMRANHQQVDANDKETIQAYINSLSIEQCQLIYLHWMLEKTMGCPNTFEYRREELTKTATTTVTDIEVLYSFIYESSPSGLTGQYLQLADIAVIIPNTGILAMHGGLTPYNIGRIPGMTTDDKMIDNIHTWINDYNRWFRDQVHDWIDYKVTQVTEPAYSKLDDVSLPLLNAPKSIMVADILDKDKQYSSVSPSVLDYLRKNKIQAVLTGHQICGDHPAIVRADNVLFINGDTGHDPRGDAWHTLEIKATPNQADISIQARLSDKTPVNTQLIITENHIIGDPYIGRVLPDHRLIQCCMPNGDYRLLNLKGKQMTYCTISTSDIEKLIDLPKQQFTMTNN